jgi:hypothetical protein
MSGQVRMGVCWVGTFGHTTPTITLNIYVGYWPDVVDCTRSLVNNVLGCTPLVPGALSEPPMQPRHHEWLKSPIIGELQGDTEVAGLQ